MIKKFFTTLFLSLFFVLFSTPTYAQSEQCAPYDFNNDGVIDASDSQSVAFRFDTKRGEPNYDEKYDVNKDGEINQADVDAMFACASEEPLFPGDDGNPDNEPVTELKDVNNPVAFGSLGELISKALPFVYAIVALLAVVVFSIGALRYLSSRGDPKAAEGARNSMTGAVIGLIIVLGAAATSGVFSAIFDLSLFGTPSRPVGPGNTQGVRLECAFQLTTGQCFGEKFSNFGELVSFILLLLLSVGGLIFFFMIIWGGFRYLMARGDEKAVTEARATLTNAAVGFLLIIAAIVIIRLITSLLFEGGVEF